MGTRPKDISSILKRLAHIELPGSARRAVEMLLKLEVPQRRIHLRSFHIDRTEVTRSAYARCVRAGRCSHVPDPSSLGAFRDPTLPW